MEEYTEYEKQLLEKVAAFEAEIKKLISAFQKENKCVIAHESTGKRPNEWRFRVKLYFSQECSWPNHE